MTIVGMSCDNMTHNCITDTDVCHCLQGNDLVTLRKTWEAAGEEREGRKKEGLGNQPTAGGRGDAPRIQGVVTP